MEPVYNRTWYAPWLSDAFSWDPFPTCQLQSVAHCMKPLGRVSLFSSYPSTNWLSRRLVTSQLMSAQGTLLPTCLITHATIWHELLIPFSFSSLHAKGKEGARSFKCLLKSDFSGIMLGINLGSCSRFSSQSPVNSTCFQFTANFSVVPAHSGKVLMLGEWEN